MLYLSTEAGELLQTEDGYLLELIVDEAVGHKPEKPLLMLARLAGINTRRRKIRRLRPTKPSHKAEAAYRADLLKIVAILRAQTRDILLPAIKAEAGAFERSTTKDELSGLKLLLAFEQMVLAFGGIDEMSKRWADEAVRRQEEVTNQQLATGIAQAMGADQSLAVSFKRVIEGLNVRAKVEMAAANNAQLIKSIPQQYIERAKSVVLNGASKGARYETIAAELEKQLGITEARAKFIARDQMASLNAAITEAKQVALGIEEYEWVTGGDERVRESHAEQNGKTYRWSDPPATGHPGEDYNCRCIARPIIKFNE